MKRTMPKLFAFAVTLAMIVSFLPAAALPASAVSTNIVISQVYGGGGNSGATYKNDFIELYNLGASSVDVTGWSVQYTSATGTGNFGSAANMITPLSGSIPAGKYLLIQEAAGSGGVINLPTPDITDSTPIAMGGSDGKVALVNTTTPLGCNGGSNPCSASALATIVDLVGYGTANFFEGSGAAPQLSNTTSDFRNGAGSIDTDNNAADFTRGAPNPRNSQYPFAAIGLATPPAILVGGSALLTVTASPAVDPPSTGLAVTCNLSPIGGITSQSFYDDGTNGDSVAGDNIFSFFATIATANIYNLACSLSDAQGRTTTTAIPISVVAIQPIGTVNGPVLNNDNGILHTSPSAGKFVAIQGVVYEKTLQAISNSSNTYKGFYIQNTSAKADGLANTSDGLFVFMNTEDTLPGGSASYTPTVGDEIVLVGKVSEYFNMTELVSYLAVPTVIRSDVVLDTEVPAVVANPPDNLADANRYWERMQGMRVQVPQDSIVLGGRNVFSPADAEIWLARSDSTIAQRVDPFTRRAFRDANPLDDNYNASTWDGNGYRILMGSLGIKGTAGDAQVLIDPARTFDTVTNSPAGGLNYTFSKYRIEITEQPIFSEGVDPATNNPVQAVADRGTAYSIADYNLENLYDFRDNPFSGCDFASDTGCPQVAPYLSAVTPAFDYVPASDAVYQARLNDISLQIIDDLHSPDILMVQEVENQDICSVVDGAMDCNTSTGNPDGKPDVLQDLALKIAANGGPAYEAAYDKDSSDLRGILPAFLYRTDRVQLLPPSMNPILEGNPVIGTYTPVLYDSDVSNPKTLNAVYTGTGACETNWVFPRAPVVALFRVSSTNISGGFQDVYVINNHFKSGPDTCVAHRTEQAKYNAALVAYIQAYNPVAGIVVGGDLNVYPLPDNTSYGATSQLASLYAGSLGLTNLWDVLNDDVPASAYSYVYIGMAQTLDQMFINGPMMTNLQDFRIAHINSDFPADYPGDVARGTSDHDPNVATFGINFNGFFPPVANTPIVNLATAGTAIPVKFSLGGDEGLKIFATGYPQSKQIACEAGTDQNTIDQTVTPGKSSLSYDSLTDQYTYIWKTQKSWVGTCRMLIVKLTDGTGQIAFFQFK